MTPGGILGRPQVQPTHSPDLKSSNSYRNIRKFQVIMLHLSGLVDCLGVIRRGQHVTVLYRQRSTKLEGEWLGRLVLGYEDGEVKIFGASIF